jgi:hypothetical protein
MKLFNKSKKNEDFNYYIQKEKRLLKNEHEERI